jgi:hypothetical protein
LPTARKVRPLKDSTSVEIAYRMLGIGIHFNEVRRFVDAQPTVDPAAETQPAPPDVDQSTVSTIPSPPSAPTTLFELPKRSPEFWDEVSEAVDQLA